MFITNSETKSDAIRKARIDFEGEKGQGVLPVSLMIRKYNSIPGGKTGYYFADFCSMTFMDTSGYEYFEGQDAIDLFKNPYNLK